MGKRGMEHGQTALKSWALAVAVLGFSTGCSGAEPRVVHLDRTSQPVRLPDCADCNVVLVSIDTLRADHLGAYGYARDTSPSLDALAERGVIFERANSASFVTADAHMSIFTSLAPSVHGVKNAVPGARLAQRLPQGLSTFPEWLKQAGYATAAFTSGGNIAAEYGFDRGMDTYRVHQRTQTGVARSLDFARARHAAGERYFVFLHTYEAHDPYLPPADFASLFYEPYMGPVDRTREELLAREPNPEFGAQRTAYWSQVDPLNELDRRQLVNAYDAEIRSIDEALSALWAGLAPLGRTLIVVTSDHGEQFAEHGRYRHNDLYQELLHVPLIVVHPEGPVAQRVSVPVSTMDIAPTLVDLLRLPVHPEVQGRSLAALSDLAPRPIFAEKEGEGEALMDGTHKLIRRPRGRSELYDLGIDPSEGCNRAQRQERAMARLTTTLDARRAENRTRRAQGVRGDDTMALDPRLSDQLRALGYGE